MKKNGVAVGHECIWYPLRGIRCYGVSKQGMNDFIRQGVGLFLQEGKLVRVCRL